LSFVGTPRQTSKLKPQKPQEMEVLSNIMAIPEKKLLKDLYRIPSITAYNRLEPRPRSENFERSLRAEVRDPLWFLTRQWQMGEFESEDTGSAIDARLITTQIHVDRIALKEESGMLYDEMIPMETFVEREKLPFTLAFKIQLGQYFLQLHSVALRTKYFDKYLTKYKFKIAEPDKEFRGQVDGKNLYTSINRRSIDGGQIFDAIDAGTFKTDVPIDGGDDLDIDKIIIQFLAWYERQYSQPKNAENSAWIKEQLSYNFSVAAPDTASTQVVLRAKNYHQGTVDWYDFDEDKGRNVAIPINDENYQVKLDKEIPISFIPAATSFQGMPNPRFWEMEERMINFGKINAKTNDHLLLLFAEFGLVYGNDWYIVPYEMRVNTLCEIKGFVVTDVFGERTLIQAANDGAENDWQDWSMFKLSNKDQIGVYNRQFYLPATLTQAMESDPIEQVNFTRDEMVNMAWGIEDIIPDATSKGINGHDAADKTGVKPEPVAESDAKIRYLLGTTVPENWIPFLPVHLSGNNQDMRFQLAQMPDLKNPGEFVFVQPKGVILKEREKDEDNNQLPFFINEEEIPYSGSIVTRSYQRARWYNGKTYIWIGRRRKTGMGEGSSKLAFDQIGSTK
jgi:hypothetical protein